MGFYHIPAGDHVSGGEVFQHHAGERPHIQGVHLHQVPGFLYSIPFGLTYSIRASPHSLTSGDTSGMGFFEHPTGLQ